MKFRNTTTIPDYALRRMLEWCRRQVGLKREHLSSAWFRNRSSTFRESRAALELSWFAVPERQAAKRAPSDAADQKKYAAAISKLARLKRREKAVRRAIASANRSIKYYAEKIRIIPPPAVDGITHV